jgi:hypothetical protein
MPASSRLDPTPLLPAETLRHIVSFIDPEAEQAFLANLCLVDSTFREIASPILYEDPGIWTSKNLLQFFEAVSQTPCLVSGEHVAKLRTLFPLSRPVFAFLASG